MAKQRQNQTEPLNDVDGAVPGPVHTRSRRLAIIAIGTAVAVSVLAISAEAITGDNNAVSQKHPSTKGYLIPEAWGALNPAGDPTVDLEGGVLNPEAYGVLTPSLLPGAPELSPEFLRALGLHG